MMTNAELSVVVIDDEECMREYLTEILQSNGYSCRAFSDGASALGWVASGEQRVDLMLSDLNMSGMSGLHLLRTVRTVSPKLPFIIISGLYDLALAKESLKAGATDYLLKPVLPADLLGLVSTHLHSAYSAKFNAVKEALKTTLTVADASEAACADQLVPIFDALGIKRFETLQHSRRVSAFALLIAQDLNFSPAAVRALKIGSLLHDVGKAGVPYNVLMKPAKLSTDEWSIMKMHPQIGLDLLSGLPGLTSEADIVYSHHERFDGTGYPRQLAGDDIPISARIFSVADTLDALTSDRCYRSGQSLAAARLEIGRACGSQFDPAVVELFNRVEDHKFEEVKQQFQDVI